MKITPYLWYNNQALEAAKFYVSVFGNKHAKILSATKAGGKITVVTVRIHGQRLILFDGGPGYKFTYAVSLSIDCKDQREVDTLWSKLSRGGKKSHCGWVQDKFGLSWQITPTALIKCVSDKDPVKADRAFKAMLQMDKIDIAKIKKAHAGK